MDTLQFVSSIVASTAWPTATVGIAVYYRTSIVDVLRRVTHVKGAGIQVDIAAQAERLREQAVNEIGVEGGDTALAGPLFLPSPERGSDGMRPIRVDEAAGKIFDELVLRAPTSAIYAAWQPVREALERFADQVGVKHLETGTTQIASHLAARGNLDPKLAALITDLRALRIEATNGSAAASSIDAYGFRRAAVEITAAIYNAMERHRHPTGSSS